MMLSRLNVSLVLMLAAVNAALAQTTSPATSASPAPPATDGGGATWLWIIIGLAIIAGLVWYFMRGRSRATTAGTTSTTGTSTTPTGTSAGRTNVYDNEKRK
jgi:predicted phage tail protein